MLATPAAHRATLLRPSEGDVGKPDACEGSSLAESQLCQAPHVLPAAHPPRAVSRP